MRNQIKSGLLVASLSLMLAVPAYAYTGTANGGNGGLGNGMGSPTPITGKQVGVGTHANETGVHDGSIVRAHEASKTTNHEISIYGTGTGSQFRNVNAGVPGTLNHHDGIRTRAYANGTTDGRYRTTAATPVRSVGWGWLGLLGLFGIAGIWNRNPQRNR